MDGSLHIPYSARYSIADSLLPSYLSFARSSLIKHSSFSVSSSSSKSIFTSISSSVWFFGCTDTGWDISTTTFSRLVFCASFNIRSQSHDMAFTHSEYLRQLFPYRFISRCSISVLIVCQHTLRNAQFFCQFRNGYIAFLSAILLFYSQFKHLLYKHIIFHQIFRLSIFLSDIQIFSIDILQCLFYHKIILISDNQISIRR